MFYVRYNKQDVRIYKFPESFPCDLKWNAMLRPRGGDQSTNIYDVNFGYQEFQYDVPFGFTPWRNRLNIQTCNNDFTQFVPCFLNYVLIIIK